MSTIPVSLTEKQFNEHVLPYISVAKRGYVSKIPLYKIYNYILYRLHTGCQWYQLPIASLADGSDKNEISYHAVYYHFRKWSKDGSLKRVWQASILRILAYLKLSELNLDGSHARAIKGGESVAYQHRKKAKTTNILPITDALGFIVACTGLLSGNHNDAFNLTSNLQEAFKFMKGLGLEILGAYFNADKAFDTKSARKTCFNHGLIPNIDENKRNRKKPKRGPKRFFNKDVYKHRFSSERTFAWIDKFRASLVRYEQREVYFLGAHFIAFAMINLRHVIQE